MSGYRVTYPGVKIISADMVHVHGVSPSVCICKAILEQGQFVESGPLQFEEDDTINMVFYDCVVSEAYAEPADKYGVLHSELTILDRRWKWKFKRVSGVYNAKENAGAVARQYEKTWDELFAIILEALGEPKGGFRVDVPDDVNSAPHVNWDDYRADLALAELAEQAGCLVVLRLDNTISIEPQAGGLSQPILDGLVVRETNWYSREIPSKIRVEFGPTIYQGWVECECVAIDIDGSMVPIGEASWIADVQVFYDNFAPGFFTSPQPGVRTDGQSLDCAFEQQTTLFRMYRIKALDEHTPIYGGTPGWLPDGNAYAESSDLRMSEHLLPHPSSGSVRLRNVEGWWSPQDSDAIRDWEPVAHVVSASGSKAYEYNIQTLEHAQSTTRRIRPPDLVVDAETNTVILPHYAYQPDYYVGSQVYWFWPASVTVRVAVTARSDQASPFHRLVYEKDTSSSNSNNGEVTIEAKLLSCYYAFGRAQLLGSYWYTNRTKLLEEVGPSIAAAYASKWSGIMPTSRNEWHGVKRLNVSGTFRSVRWHVSQRRVFTHVGKNLEDHRVGPTHSQRRIAQGQWHV